MLKNDTYSFDKILREISMGFMASILFSYKLWTSEREFPTFPIFEWLSLPVWLEYGFLSILIISLTLLIIFKSQRVLLSRISLLLLIFLLMVDQMRIQPWTYFFGLLILPFSITENKNEIIGYLKFLLIVLYIWSGIHKFNPYFEILIFEDILVHLFGAENPSLLWMRDFSIMIPILEILAGLFLLFKSSFRIGLYTGILIHSFIILFILFVMRGNYVIIPWNIVMIVILLSLIKESRSNENVLMKNKILITALVLVCLLPIGNLLGKVDQSLAFSLYDGKINEIYITSSENKYIDDHHEYLFKDIIEEGSVISLSVQSHSEIKVPFYPEKRFLDHLQNNGEIDSNSKIISTKLPLWKIGYFSEQNKNHSEILFQSGSIPNIKLKEGLLTPKWTYIK